MRPVRLSVTRITREPVEGKSVSRDYEFSRKSIDQHIARRLCANGENVESRWAFLIA